MADKKKKKKKNSYKGYRKKSVKREIKKQDLLGTFDEDTGGGEPMGKDQRLRDGGRGTWTKNYHKEPEREPDQPRTKDGKFTYNSANGKELKDISKSHGKSRGTTVPPQLTGGKNGIHFYKAKRKEDGNLGHRDFSESGGILEGAEGKLADLLGIKEKEVYRKGDKVAYKGGLRIMQNDFVESAQQYVRSDGEKEMAEKLESIDITGREAREIMKDAGVFGKGTWVGDRPSGKLEKAETTREKSAVKEAETGVRKLLPGDRSTVERGAVDQDNDSASRQKRNKAQEKQKRKEQDISPEQAENIINESGNIEEVAREVEKETDSDSEFESFMSVVNQASEEDKKGFESQMDEFADSMNYVGPFKNWKDLSFEEKVKIFYNERKKRK